LRDLVIVFGVCLTFYVPLYLLYFWSLATKHDQSVMYYWLFEKYIPEGPWLIALIVLLGVVGFSLTRLNRYLKRQKSIEKRILNVAKEQWWSVVQK